MTRNLQNIIYDTTLPPGRTTIEHKGKVVKVRNMAKPPYYRVEEGNKPFDEIDTREVAKHFKVVKNWLDWSAGNSKHNGNKAFKWVLQALCPNLPNPTKALILVSDSFMINGRRGTHGAFSAVMKYGLDYSFITVMFDTCGGGNKIPIKPLAGSGLLQEGASMATNQLIGSPEGYRYTLELTEREPIQDDDVLFYPSMAVLGYDCWCAYSDWPTRMDSYPDSRALRLVAKKGVAPPRCVWQKDWYGSEPGRYDRRGGSKLLARWLAVQKSVDDMLAKLDPHINDATLECYGEEVRTV